MKLTRTKKFLVTVFALASGFFAAAQSNGVPSGTDYAQFSRFIAERNIFDPNRHPHTRTNYHPHPRPHTAGTPTITLVGTMTYQKGVFAFFNGNSSDLKQILTTGGKVAGYTVEHITLKGVKLLGAGQKEIEMKLGDQMQQVGDQWELTGQGQPPGSPGTANENSSASADSSPAASSANLEGNDVLKRLMQQREQELK